MIDVVNYADINQQRTRIGAPCQIYKVIRKKDEVSLSEDFIDGTYDCSWPGEGVNLGTPDGVIQGRVNGLNTALGFFTVKAFNGNEYYVKI